jgi:ADP-ribosylglycohydrolase
MRTAFLGFCFVDNPAALAQLVGAVARITHHDPRSIAGGIAIAEACRLLVTTPAMPRDAFFHAVATSIQPFDHAFGQAIAALADHAPTSPTVLHAIAWAGLTRPEFEQPIITPFVIPTVLAALWMVATYPTSWTAAVAHTIGLGGDVDTLGAIVGGLMGAKLGVQALPPLLVAQLQSHDQIVQYGEQFAALLNAGFVVNR